jgi:hypothetical protein
MIVATAWSVALWRRIGDWRGGMLPLLLSAMTAHQFVRFVAWREAGGALPGAGWGPEQLQLLVQALLAALAVALLEAAMRARLTMLTKMRD